MHRSRTTPIGAPVFVLSALGLSLAAGTAAAADPDLRKLEDKLTPVHGDIWRLGDPVPRDGGFASSGMTCLSRVPLNNFTGVNSQFGNDCWGYVSPSGREYAIMGVYGGFGFVEITDPTNPVVIDTVAGPISDWHDVKVIGQYAYGVSEGGSGIQVMDLRNIDSGTVPLIRNWTSSGYSSTHNIVSNEESGSLWICGANIGNGGLINIDLSNPQLPSFNGGWTDMYVHDAQVATMQSGPFAGRELAFCGAGFDGGFTQTGLRIVDVTNPNNTQVLSTLFYPQSGYAHQVWLSDDQKYIYLNDELDEGSSVAVTTTRIINVEDPANPFFVGTFTTGLQSIDHNLYVRDGLIYQSNYTSGLRVFDAIDPENPIEIAFFDTRPEYNGVSFNGAWSNYPYFPSGTIIVSDIERGLFMLRLDAEPAVAFASVAGVVPAVIDPTGGDSLSVDVTLRAGNDVSAVDLLVTTPTGLETVAASDNGDGTYTAQFPAVPCDTQVLAYFRVTLSGGQQVFAPSGGAAEALEFIVSSDQDTVFADNFQTNQGWSVSGPVSGADSGQWERAVPNGAGDRGDPPADSDGSGFCYVTGNGAGNTDVDGGQTILTSPTLDASGAGDAFISYDRWYNNVAGASPNADVFTVQVSGNNGSSWTTVEVVGPAGEGTSGGWVASTFRVADYITPSSNTRVRFIADDAGDGSVIEAGVDAFDLTFLSCEDAPDCVADFAEPFGTLNFFDISAYITAFNAGDASADLAAPFGSLNFFDISAYITAFNAGCP
ncbi:MAG: choice-of-anchor B family protein [Planctomycetota bacterium]